MTEKWFRRGIAFWCLVLSVWGLYFTWRFIQHEEESLGRSNEVHSTLLEVREILAEQKELLKENKELLAEHTK